MVCLYLKLNCPQCAKLARGGKPHCPLLDTIPVKHPFQIVGVVIMDLALAIAGNKHVLFSKMTT